MKIVVCVKHVPDVQGERRFVDRVVDRSGGDGALNELDEYAVEAALALAEPTDAQVTAVSMGPADAEDAVRRALQMGVDSGVLVSDEALAGSDVFSTAAVLAAAIRVTAGGPVDLVLTGVSALDSLTGALPALLAAELAVPYLGHAAALELAGGSIRMRRDGAHSTDLLAADLPAVVSVTDRANTPRYPDFKKIMAARKKSVTHLDLDDLAIDPSAVGWAGARVEVVSVGERPRRTDRLMLTDDGTAARRVADYLLENGLVR